MKFTTNKTDLANAFNRLRLAKNGEWCATLSFHEDQVVWVSRGQDMYASVIVPVTGMLNAYKQTITIPITTLDRWVKGVQGEVHVEADYEGAQLIFTTDDAKLPVPMVSDDSHLVAIMPELDADALEAPDGLWDALEGVAWCCNNELDRYTGYVHVSGDTVWASDTYRMAMAHVPGLDLDVSIPDGFNRVIDQMDPKTTWLHLDERTGLRVEDHEGRFVLSTFTDEKPTLDQLRLVGSKKPGLVYDGLTVDRKAAVDAVRKVLALAGKSEQHRVILAASGFNLTIATTTKDGRLTTRIVQLLAPADWTARAFNGSFLADMLDSFGTETVTLHSSGLNPVLAERRDEDGETTYMVAIMPIRCDIPKELEDG